jgi:xylan 1,4-beta-xylosidase
VLPVKGTHRTVSVWVVRRENSVTVLLTNHAMPRHPIGTEQVRVTLWDARPPRLAYVERIDEEHANARRQWAEMGEPEYPGAIEVEQLQAASCVARQPHSVTYDAGVIDFDVTLPPHAVAAVTIEFASDADAGGAAA